MRRRLHHCRHLLEELNRTLSATKVRVRLARYVDAVRDEAAVRYGDVGENDVLLCLYLQARCVSSISGKFTTRNPGRGSRETCTLTIASRTAPEHEGKRYNRFLRAVLIQLAPALGVDEVVSVAVNPVSTYLMHRYFGATCPELGQYCARVYKGRRRQLTPAIATAFHAWLRKQARATVEADVDAELDELAKNAAAEQGGDYLAKFGWASRAEARSFLIEQSGGSFAVLTVQIHPGALACARKVTDAFVAEGRSAST